MAESLSQLIEEKRTKKQSVKLLKDRIDDLESIINHLNIQYKDDVEFINGHLDLCAASLVEGIQPVSSTKNSADDIRDEKEKLPQSDSDLSNVYSNVRKEIDNVNDRIMSLEADITGLSNRIEDLKKLKTNP